MRTLTIEVWRRCIGLDLQILTALPALVIRKAGYPKIAQRGQLAPLLFALNIELNDDYLSSA